MCFCSSYNVVFIILVKSSMDHVSVTCKQEPCTDITTLLKTTVTQTVRLRKNQKKTYFTHNKENNLRNIARVFMFQQRFVNNTDCVI